MDVSWVLGHARTTFTHSSHPVLLTTKSGTQITFSDLCSSATPPCHLNPLLFNGHLQTFWTVVKSQDVPVTYKRKIFEADDPVYAGTFAVDFVSHTLRRKEGDDELDEILPRTTYFTNDEFASIGSEDTKPLLIALHGLSGGSHELYLRHVLAPLTKREDDGGLGWEALVVNSRGCANSKITTGVLFNARATWDVRQVVKWCRETFPNRPLFAIGFSLGANILTNVCTIGSAVESNSNQWNLTNIGVLQYFGEEGDQCVLKAAVVCSNPFNLEAGSLALQRTWLGREVYSKTMARNMKRLFERSLAGPPEIIAALIGVPSHVDQISKNPRIDVERVRKVEYLYEFDREVQGPTWGYPTEGAYYRDASSSDSVLAIRIPLFAINAEDDPIAVKEAIPFEEFKQNPYTVLCTTSLGGHLSWFEIGGGRWFARAAIDFLRKMAAEIDLGRSDTYVSLQANGVAKPGPDKAIFEPMRRKLHIVR